MNKLLIATLMLALLAPFSLAEEAEQEERQRCPADTESCLNWMAGHYKNRGWAGVQLDEGTYEITKVHEGMPAEEAGLKVGDVLVAINGIEIREENNEKLYAMQDQMRPGNSFTYTLKRKGKRFNRSFELVEMPFEVVATMVGMHMLTDHAVLSSADASHTHADD